MKKWLLIFGVAGLLFWTWVALRLTHTLDFYSIRSRSNLPTLDSGRIVFTSNLKATDYNTFVCFKLPNKKSPWIFRCIGKAGDIIEIRNARVYRNGVLLDEPFTNNEYTITQAKLNRIMGYVKQNKNDLVFLKDSTYKLTLSGKELKYYHLKLTPVISAKGVVNEDIFTDFKNAGYNEDNFGPLKVPSGSFFLMGDNRHDAFDSRYIGFIKKDEIISTVLNY